ncbi:TerB family tellurite resistance protein [Photobacterium damselae]|uniref:TerB family tellurite resistance protein n=1 Tax=Photobacterium damselae subsp. damselae TaxID=85581 RepID=A0AAD3ZW25_PHODD|nr:TerB family tellurite resistance protein [Photobacterium damselae]KAB1181979.1 TerB family tellurite resistance protein [Photobacterium damselae subsp. damselae]
MFTKLRTLLRQVMNDGTDAGTMDSLSINLAMASLLCEVANADHAKDPREEQAKVQLLTKLLEVDEQQAQHLLNEGELRSENAVSLYEFTNKLRALEQEARYELVEAMWQVAYADGVIDPMEEAVIRQVAELIYLDHSEFIRAKLSAQKLAQ